jgi:endothelin-converting enzyme
MDEKRLDELGEEPLVYFVQTIRDLFRGESIEIGIAGDDEDEKRKGLTAAISFLHSRGKFVPCKYGDCEVLLIVLLVGIDALFSFDVDGDSGVDPNAMTLWFSQPGLGLPSKVGALVQYNFDFGFADLSWQEYYEDKSIRMIYQDVIERLLSALAEEDENEDLTEKNTNILMQQDDSENVWPPWPWPPWGDDDDDKTPKPPKPESPLELAKKVLKFESQIANASLDLYVDIRLLSVSLKP